MFNPTETHVWMYEMVLDLLDNDQGVIFYRFPGGNKYKVLFAGNDQVCLDWMRLPRDSFFQKYTLHDRAEMSCRVSERYIAEKSIPMARKRERKPLNMRITS